MSSVEKRIIVVLLCVLIGGLLGGAALEERKVAVGLSKLPDFVKQAVNRELPEAKILACEKEVAGEDPGQFDLVVASKGKTYEVEVSPAGKVLEVKEIPGESQMEAAGTEKKWTKSFHQDKCTFASSGRNHYFVLEVGHQLVLESAEEKVTITVLDETKVIGGIETRVIEEREEEHGALKEVSRNFFAICVEHGDVYYFGEEVDDYEDGKVVGHGGAWRADAQDSQAGIMMPGTPLLGARHYQEIAPNAMDRAEIMADDVVMKTPAATFKGCLRVEETSPLEPGSVCYKTYAPGIGLIQDEDLVLTSYRTAKGN